MAGAAAAQAVAVTLSLLPLPPLPADAHTTHSPAPARQPPNTRSALKPPLLTAVQQPLLTHPWLLTTVIPHRLSPGWLACWLACWLAGRLAGRYGVFTGCSRAGNLQTP
jgi:hypothetical protein